MKYEWNEIKWQIEYVGDVTDVISPKPKVVLWSVLWAGTKTSVFSSKPAKAPAPAAHSTCAMEAGVIAAEGSVGIAVGGVRDQISEQKVVVTMTIVYSTLQNQFDIFHSLVDHGF